MTRYQHLATKSFGMNTRLKSRLTVLTLFSIFMLVPLLQFLKSSPVYVSFTSSRNQANKSLSPSSSSSSSSSSSIQYNFIITSQGDNRSYASFISNTTGPGYCARPVLKAKLRNSRWYITTHLYNNNYTEEISVFGAYADNRRKNFTSIRVIGVSNSAENRKIYCLLWYNGRNDGPVVLNATTKKTGRGLNVEKRFNQERMYTCQLPNESFPQYVSVSFKSCDSTAPLVPLIVPEVLIPRIKLGVCMAVTFGTIDDLRVIEWLEFHSLLGVEEFNIYTSNINSSTYALLKYYTLNSLVRLTPIGPAVESNCFWCHKLSTIAVLNDCMYRNMYRYEYVIVMDFDEFLIPYQHGSLTNILNYINTLKPSVSYLFSNAYHFLELPPVNLSSSSDELAKDLLTQTMRRRLQPSHNFHSPKSFVNPRRCGSLQNHYCTVSMEKENATWMFNVNTTMMVVHHYKKCSKTSYNATACKTLMNNTVIDDRALDFQQVLVQRVRISYANFKQILLNNPDALKLDTV